MDVFAGRSLTSTAAAACSWRDLQCEERLCRIGIARRRIAEGGLSLAYDTTGVRPIYDNPSSLSASGSSQTRSRHLAAEGRQAVPSKRTVPVLLHGRWSIGIADLTYPVTLEEKPETLKQIALYMSFKFDRIHQKGQPEEKAYDCVASTTIEVEFQSKYFFLDRSCSNMGFLVHRPHAIKKCSRFIPLEYKNPSPTPKYTKEKNWLKTFGFGGTASHTPSATINAQWTKGGKQGEEQQYSRPLAQCPVKSDPGPPWDSHDPENVKSFKSWDFSWCPNDNQYGERYDAIVGFDIMLDLYKAQEPSSATLPSDVSCVMRNQVMVWDSHPVGSVGTRSRMTGFMLVASTYVPNVFTHESLNIREDIKLQYDSQSKDITHGGSRWGLQSDHADNYAAVGRLPEAQNLKQPNALIKTFQLLKRPAPTQGTKEFPLYETIRPNDNNIYQWLSPQWLGMDAQLDLVLKGAKDSAVIEWKRMPAKLKDAPEPGQAATAENDITAADASSSTSTSQPWAGSSSGPGTATDTQATTPASSPTPIPEDEKAAEIK
ncbi:hypothetical protein HMN09_01139800 [Mycena chlorophos]|uniref:Uncharacterized protein n=1 Tax=Mycena chlorophos TaxID=658473 RepID=A0A8H6SA50_MYCCL|nr:hypothetical protein HMN09_01139800 [Mycena chlorophos]